MKRVLFGLIGSGILWVGLGAFSWAQTEPNQPPIKAYIVGSEIRITNPEWVEYTVEITLTTQVNLNPTCASPCRLVVPPKSDVSAIQLKPQGEQAWRVNYHFICLMGDIYAQHDDRIHYLLPYARQKNFLLTQGYHGAFSHQGAVAYALDFIMPTGTPIYAAREGTVVRVVTHYTAAGVTPEFHNQANVIYVRHADHTVGRYVHLKPDGSLVSPGMKVVAGQHIGYSGHTGYSTQPHLHFDVSSPESLENWRSWPTIFVTDTGPETLKEGETYRRP